MLGFIPVVLGVALRVWAAGLLEKGGSLCTDGPYRFVRHPLYLGSLLAAVGFVVMMNAVWGWAAILPLFLVLYTIQMLREEHHLRTIYGEVHERYVRMVPMLVPSPGRRAEPQGRRWDRARMLRNREHYHVIVALGFAVLFVAKWLMGQ